MTTEIKKFKPCEKAVVFREQYTSFEEAWRACPRGDWMLWLAKKLDIDLLILTKAKALCALTVRHLMKDERSIRACEVAIQFSEGKATRNQLNNAAYAAYAYAAYAYADAAAYAAAYAADSADAADAAADAAYAAYADAAKIKNQKRTADICREVLTREVFKKIKQNF